MSKFVPAILAALLLTIIALVQPVDASAGLEWCWDDPVVRIDGHTVSVAIGVLGDPMVVRKQIEVAETMIFVPPGVRTEIVSTTDTFFRETVTFAPLDQAAKVAGSPTDVASGRDKARGIPVIVMIRFKAGADLPARAAITYPGGHVDLTGSTAGQMRAAFTLSEPTTRGPAAPAP